MSVSVFSRNITEDDEHEREVVPGPAVAAADVDVASEGGAHQQRHTADALHKTPAPREVFGSNPANKENQKSLKLCFLLRLLLKGKYLEHIMKAAEEQPVHPDKEEMALVFLHRCQSQDGDT